jgi:PadR family transcriptional regulator PadR
MVTMNTDHRKTLQREVLLSVWKVHILHHAGKSPLIGQWMLRELRQHGYDISPGTLYPLLHRMEDAGWLHGDSPDGAGKRAPRRYTLTAAGREVMSVIRRALSELVRELEGEDTDAVDSEEGRR